MRAAPITVTAPPMQKPVTPTFAPSAARWRTAPRTTSPAAALKSSAAMAALAAGSSWYGTTFPPKRSGASAVKPSSPTTPAPPRPPAPSTRAPAPDTPARRRLRTPGETRSCCPWVLSSAKEMGAAASRGKRGVAGLLTPAPDRLPGARGTPASSCSGPRRVGLILPGAQDTSRTVCMRKPRILVVDDERVVVEVLTNLLEDPDRELLTADCAAGALEHARAGEIEVALVDKNLGADSGLELSRALKQAQPELEVILITGYASIESAIEAVQIGAFDYLTKPIADFSALSFKVQSALEKSQLKRSQRALLERLMECEVRHRRLIDAAPEAIVLYDAATGLVVEANEAAVKLY